MKPLAARACPVCRAEQPQALNQRRFAQLPGLDGEGYTQHLAACGACGALYVTAYLDPHDLARYYATMSSYEYLVSDGEVPAEERLRSERQVAFLRPYLADGAPSQVLDVGCSIGHTLHLLARLGHQVRGIEPSQALSDIARARYGVAVDTTFVDEHTTLPGGQHLVLLSHVLEHLLTPHTMLAAIRRALRPDGLLFIEVPGIELFDERDLFQLSFEHVNYFSHGSLSNLMHAAGFEAVDHVVFENDDGSSPHYPTLGSLWRPASAGSRPWPLVPRDAHDVPVMRRYLALVAGHALDLDARVAAALQGPQPLVLWGAGTLSAQLLANTALAQARAAIAGLLDIDPKKHGLMLEGLPVFHPDSAEGQALLLHAGQLLIGSWSSQEAIHQGLLGRGIAPGRIVRLFGR